MKWPDAVYIVVPSLADSSHRLVAKSCETDLRGKRGSGGNWQ